MADQTTLIDSSCVVSGRKAGSNGYVSVKVNGKFYKETRLVYYLYYKRMPLKNEVVRHKCDNPVCINPLHIEVGTHKDNALDRVRRGRGAANEKHGRAKLDRSTVLKIRELKGIMSQRKVAKLFNISQTQVGNIMRRTHWKI